MKKILIAGVTGQLGSALKKNFSSEFKVFGLSRNSENNAHFFKCDITDNRKLEIIFNIVKPDIVINTAALGHADTCEAEKEHAYRINYLGNNNLLSLSRKYNSYFVFMSSYYVFDGHDKEYNESHYVCPLNYYGITKIMSEIETSGYKNSLIIRSSKIISLGYGGKNLIVRLDNDLKNKRKVQASSDQYNNPITANFMADTIKKLILKSKTGVFNIGGENYVSNYELSLMFASLFGYDASLISGIVTKTGEQLVIRPKDVFLTLDKLKKAGIDTYNLDQMFNDMKNGR